MPLLATDLDRTLLPNGRWPADPSALGVFAQWVAEHRVPLVYVTGRSLELTEEAIRTYGLPRPEYVCADVGASVWSRDGEGWQAAPGWAERVAKASPAWDPEAVDAALHGWEGLVPQGAAQQSRFKRSYDFDVEAADAVEALRTHLGGRFDEVLVDSHDPQKGVGLLDVMARAATKRSALEFVADARGVPYSEVVFCGDSGNDLAPMTGAFCGVMVRNADARLVEGVAEARRDQPELRVYHAQGGFRGLSGYYTSGVLEGAAHYGLFELAE